MLQPIANVVKLELVADSIFIRRFLIHRFIAIVEGSMKRHFVLFCFFFFFVTLYGRIITRLD